MDTKKRIEKYLNEDINLFQTKWTKTDREGYTALEAENEQGKTIYPIQVSSKHVPKDVIQKIEDIIIKNKDRIG
jgi:uncharacterized protein VirK/YbjX